MLLDTHVVLWLLSDDASFGAQARAAVAAATAVHVSAASVWEIAIKTELGKLEVPDDLLERIEQAGLVQLPVTGEHSWATRTVTGLPHRDPFDRLLLAQARLERLTLVTADRALLAADLGAGPTVVDARA